MSDEELRELERAYSQDPTEERLEALLVERAKAEPFPCPCCGRRISVWHSGESHDCAWCGLTGYHPKAASRALWALRDRQRTRARNAVLCQCGHPFKAHPMGGACAAGSIASGGDGCQLFVGATNGG